MTNVMTASIITAALNAVALFIIFAMGVPFVRWLEKRSGFRSCIADVIKIITKKTTGGTHTSTPLAIIASILAVLAPIAAAAFIPLFPEAAAQEGPLLHAVSHEAGLLVVCACIILGSSIPLIAGWSSKSTFAILGGLRAPAQAMNYGLAFIAAVAAIVCAVGSLDISTIITHQGTDPLHWFVVRQPLAFLIVMFSTLAASLRPPFDAPHCRRELIAGYMTDADGSRIVLFTLAHYLLFVTGALLISALFLGGGGIPGLPTITNPYAVSLIALGALVFKTIIVIALLSQLRRIVARLRCDQFLRIGWLMMLPLAVLNLIVTIMLYAGEV